MLGKISAMPYRTKFFAVVGLQIAILLFLIISFGSVISSGRQIYLRIAPVDPTDPLRGDYVTFQYEGLSRVEMRDGYEYYGNTTGGNRNNNQYRVGEVVYVQLLESGSYWYADYNPVSKSMPREGVFLQGTVTNVTRSVASGLTTLNISYGIEEYFIPEGTGRNVSFWNEEVMAEVYVNSAGKAVLKRLFRDGKPWP